MKSLRIRSINIENIARIENLKLTFSEDFNLICGPNGIGKSTILECIAHAFSHTTWDLLRKRVGQEKGSYIVNAEGDGQPINITGNVAKFEPHEAEWAQGPQPWLDWVVVLKSNRAFNYVRLEHISRDPIDVHRVQHLGPRGIEYTDIKNWFVNRFMFSAHTDNLSAEQLKNLELAKRSFGLLDPTVSFTTVKADTFDLMVKTADGEIYFEYLSSGFKSSICLVVGLIKEIEYRFKHPYVAADEFCGVIVIDELDIHLHPDWQARLLGVLVAIFPKAQFIAATHSPHMVQSAKPREIIALEADENGRIRQRELPTSDYGFQGWTIEEILEDVMGMTDTRSAEYRKFEAEFDAAIERGDASEARRVASILDRFLNPQNVQRKLFQLQLGRFSDTSDSSHQT